MAGTPPLQTVLKTIQVLEALAQEEDSVVTLARLADALGWSRASTHQYLSSLVRAGWLDQDAARRYRIGSGIALFVRALAGRELLPGIIREVMAELVAELHEPISFAVLHGDGAEIVERYEPERALIHRNPHRQLSFTSASGLVLLAFDRRADATPYPDQHEQIEAVRRDGYAKIHSIWVGDDVEAVAVPVMSGDWCLGAMSVIAPTGRMSVPGAISSLTAARQRIEAELE